MKNRIAIVVLALVCIGLVIGLVTVNKHSADRQRQDADTIVTYSNKWVKTTSDLDEQRTVAALLEKDLDKQKQALTQLTNTFTQVSTTLVQTEASLKQSEEEVRKQTAKITELENQNQLLDKQASDLSASITNLNLQIDDTRKKLAASEGDKVFLEGELKRLMAEKAELERQFNDLTVLRAQVAKLKEELSISRRLEWIRQGLFASAEQKGAQKLMQGVSSPTQARPARPNYDLNVEVGSDGSVRVIGGQTNGPAAKPAPPK